MCGIGGSIDFRNDELLKEQLLRLIHRGPDFSNTWSSKNDEYPAQFCHARLSIFDTSYKGHQPLVSEDERYVLVYNGEIYNFLELKNKLQKLGYNFKSESDSEVLLYGLIEFGIDFISKCNGMWAFCLWDRSTKKALLARDRFGVKPLYYHQSSLGFSFASEMKALLPFVHKKSLNNNIDQFFKNIISYESTKSCIYNHIYRLQAGHFIVYEGGKLSIKRWWNTLDNLKYQEEDYNEQVEHWKSLFIDSVRIRMQADVPIASALSGGLDSSSVSAIIHSINKSNKYGRSNNWQMAFCSYFQNSSLDESKWAELVSNEYDIPLKKVLIDPSAPEFSISDSLAFMEDPYKTLPLPMMTTYRSIKQSGVKVTLDGTGADELFSGYGHIIKAITNNMSRSEFKEILAIDESTRSGIYSNKHRINLKTKLRGYIFYYYFKYSQNVKSCFPILNDVLKDSYSESNSINKSVEEHPAFKEMDALSQVLYYLFHFSYLPTLLRNYDRYSMASGVEIRMPFMDWRLILYTFSIPWRSKLGGGYTKRILRDSVKGTLLDEVRLRRDKKGWTSPMHEWLRGPIKDEVFSLITQNKEDIRYNKSIKVYNNFLNEGYIDFKRGQKTWEYILPLIWRNSIRNQYLI